jgi:hypothetical protein
VTRYLRHSLLLPILPILMGALPAPGRAAVHRLYPDGGGDFPTIALALHHAISGDIIELGDGVFRGPGNRDLDFDGKAIWLRSLSGRPERCILDAEGSAAEPHRLFRFVSGEGSGTLVRGLTLTGGYLPDSGEDNAGGAIYCRDSAPRVEDCVIAGNHAWRGGGVYALGALPQLRDCTFSENEAGYFGGGLAAENLAGDLVQDCRFQNNTAPYGGGIALRIASPAIAGCVIAGNVATEKGGGLYAGDAAFPELSDCTLADNDSPIGSCIALVFNCGLQGQGLLIAFGGGGGAAVDCDISSSADLSCSDVYGTVAGNWTGCLAGQLGAAGNIEADPLFCPGGDYGLAAGSPCSADESACGLIGALPVSCGARLRAASSLSWGTIKGLYRGS